tara:strand:+ start:4782 stop:5036 length:255 start_codon:yes stop_codon:yes gene_type:complete
MSKKGRTQRELTPIEKQVQDIVKRRQDFALLVAFSDLALELEKTDKMIQEMEESPEKAASRKKQEEAWELLLGKDMFGNIASEA